MSNLPYGPNVKPTAIQGVNQGTVTHIKPAGPMTAGMGSVLQAGSGAQQSNWVMQGPKITAPVTYVDARGTELVRIDKDGSVVWPNGYHIDEAAKSLEKSFYLSIEQKVSVTEGIKRRMRDSVFAELIKLANETGSITTEELTRYWEAAKIIDKLKGPE